MARAQESLTSRPLYIFDLPDTLLSTLQVKAQDTHSAGQSLAEEELVQPVHSPNPATRPDDGRATATSCNLCGLQFNAVAEQRTHVRSDLHGFNLKQKLRGKLSVTEAEFERLIEELDESISGSDTSISPDEEDSWSPDGLANGSRPRDTMLSSLLKKQASLNDEGTEHIAATQRKSGSGKPPLIWFSSTSLPENTSLGIYRAVFSYSEQNHEDQLVEILRTKQLRPRPAPSAQRGQQKQVDDDEGGVALPSSVVHGGTGAAGPFYFLCMIGGGHFAAMIVSLSPKLVKKGGIEDRSATVVAHKTFHRYTTRRKQGGSQSANDNSKGNAHSAGSSIRRYNENALMEEVRALLAGWRELIAKSDLLFIRATGSANRRTLYGPYDEQVLNSRDERIRGFPFTTRRATQAELMRAFVELTRVKMSTIDEAQLAKIAEETEAAEALAESQKTPKAAAPTSKKPSKEDEEASVHSTQLQALIRRSKVPAMLSYLSSNSLSPDFALFPAQQNHHAPTILHVAAATNSPACVTALLIKAGSNPVLQNGDGKSAFEIAGDRATRDAFRLARAQLGEDRWQWDVANVGSALSQNDVDARAARERQEKSATEVAEKQRREAETERLRREDADKLAANRDRKFGQGQSLLSGTKAMTAEERRAEQARGMTDEMRMKLEREKRARAAEERMKRLQKQ